jgi:hypothetical protein
MTKALRLSAKARAAAKQLAIRFDAFNEACREERYSGIISWGFMLQRAQLELGVEVIKNDHIERMVDMALRKTAKPAREHMKSLTVVRA